MRCSFVGLINGISALLMARENRCRRNFLVSFDRIAYHSGAFVAHFRMTQGAIAVLISTSEISMSSDFTLSSYRIGSGEPKRLQVNNCLLVLEQAQQWSRC